MVDYLAHWATLCRCSSCGKNPETGPLYHCKFQHQYCSSCFENIQKKSEGECVCLVCKKPSVFEKSNIHDDFLKKIRAKPPGIGRPSRYNETNPNNNNSQKINILIDEKSDNNNNNQTRKLSKITVEKLFKIPNLKSSNISTSNLYNNTLPSASSNCNEVVRKFENLSICKSNTTATNISENCGSVSYSKRPLICPHDYCNRVIAVSSFANHFKYEHLDIPRYTIQRGNDLVLPFKASTLCHSWSYCLAIITIYDVSKIDTRGSKSTKSVQNTCSKFSQKVPVNTFWLMVNGSAKGRKSYTYALFWLLADCDDLFKCIIELSSKFERKSCSTYCSINDLREYNNINDIFEIAQNLNCLLLSRASLISLLHEGPELNLRVSIH